MPPKKRKSSSQAPGNTSKQRKSAPRTASSTKNQRQSTSNTDGNTNNASTHEHGGGEQSLDLLLDQLVSRLETRGLTVTPSQTRHCTDGTEGATPACLDRVSPPRVVQTPVIIPDVQMDDTADHTVYSATAALRAFAGAESLIVPTPTDCIRVSDHLTDKQKQSIIDGNFVELSSLLPDSVQDENVQINVQSGPDAVLRVSSKPKTKELSLYSWMTAFHIYIDVYATRHPESLPGLLCYISLIRDLERNFGHRAFTYYDTAFRKQRELHALPWGVMHQELWMRATTIKSKFNVQPAKPVSNQSQTPKGQCFSFNRRSGCLKKGNCPFLHICANCGANHPRYRCPVPVVHPINTQPITPVAIPEPPMVIRSPQAFVGAPPYFSNADQTFRPSTFQPPAFRPPTSKAGQSFRASAPQRNFTIDARPNGKRR